VPSPSLESCEALAGDLVEAWRSGEAGALARVADLFGIERGLGWDRPPPEERIRRLRRHVRERLGAPRQTEGGMAEGGGRAPAQEAGSPDDLSRDEARLLVARAHGFEDWARLVRSAG
jgi:hypothetical protein